MIYLCTPAPLAGACHYFLIYLFRLFILQPWTIPEEEAWDSETGAIQSAQEEFIWERIEIIGSGTVSPTVGKAFQGVKKNTLLTLEFKEGSEECLGTKGHPWSKYATSPTSGASDNVLRVLHSASTLLVR